MAKMDQYFDATNIDLELPSQDFSALPPGDYPMMVVASENKEAQSGNKYLDLTLEVIEGQYKGRKIWQKIHLENSAKAVAISKREMGSLCAAINVNGFDESSDVHNQPIIGAVIIEKGRNGYKDSNKCSIFKPYNSAPATHATHATPAPAGTMFPDWAGK